MINRSSVLAVLALAAACVGSTDTQEGSVSVNYLPNP